MNVVSFFYCYIIALVCVAIHQTPCVFLTVVRCHQDFQPPLSSKSTQPKQLSCLKMQFVKQNCEKNKKNDGNKGKFYQLN